jgi:hypothetical protein
MAIPVLAGLDGDPDCVTAMFMVKEPWSAKPVYRINGLAGVVAVIEPLENPRPLISEL